MRKPTCTRILEFDAGHRLQRHESKCRNVHGHRYKVELTCEAAQLDDVGRVIDFSAIKELVGTWLDDQLDHGFIAEYGDPLIPAVQADGTKLHLVPWPPTAENLARYIAANANAKLNERGIRVVRVVLWETPNCFATWESEQ